MKGVAIFLYLSLAGIAGFALFHITYKVEQLEHQLATLNKEILKEQNAVHVLKAEWSFLGRPERIEELRRQFLPNLQPLQTTQIGGLDDLPHRTAPLADAPSQTDTPKIPATTAPIRPVSAKRTQ
jgi:cell division protein FtsL